MLGSFIRRSSFWIIDFFKGGEIYKHYKDVVSIMSNSKESEKRYTEHLNKLLFYVTNNIEFYKDFASFNNIKDFPVINKEIVKNNENRIKSREFKDKDLYVVSTSGSTGTPFTIQQNKNKRNRLKADLIYFGEMCNYKIGDKYVHFRVWSNWKSKNSLSQFKQNVIPVDISKLDDNVIDEIHELLKNNKKITCLNGYAKSLDIIANYILNNKGLDKKNNISIVISSAEILTKNIKNNIKKAFNSNVVSRYANEEIGFLAQQPVDDDYFFINKASIFMEFIKIDSDNEAEPGELSRVVVTDLFNYATPLIRYDTGDLAVYENHSAKGKVIREIQGRSADFIYDTRGNRLVSFSVTNKMERTRGIIQYQLIQNAKDKYKLKLKVNDNIFKEAEIIILLKSVLGEDAFISIDYVDKIDSLSSGKYKTIICEYKR